MKYFGIAKYRSTRTKRLNGQRAKVAAIAKRIHQMPSCLVKSSSSSSASSSAAPPPPPPSSTLQRDNIGDNFDDLDKEIFSNFIETSARKIPTCEAIQKDDAQPLSALYEPSTTTTMASIESRMLLSIISSPLKFHSLNRQVSDTDGQSTSINDEERNIIGIWEKLMHHDDEIQKLTMGFTSCLETIRQLNEKLMALVPKKVQEKTEKLEDDEEGK